MKLDGCKIPDGKNDLTFRYEIQAGYRMRLKAFGDACLAMHGLLAEIEKETQGRKRARLTWEIVNVLFSDTEIGLTVRAKEKVAWLDAFEDMLLKLTEGSEA